MTGRVWLRFPSRPGGEGAAPWLEGQGSVPAGRAQELLASSHRRAVPAPVPAPRVGGAAAAREVRAGAGAAPRDRGLPAKAGVRPLRTGRGWSGVTAAEFHYSGAFPK